MAKYRHLFSLTWYNNLTYAQSKNFTSKALPIAYYNGLNYKSMEPEYTQQEKFIDTVIPKIIEVD